MTATHTRAVVAAILMCAAVATANLGGDVSEPFSEADFSCAKSNSGWDFVVVRTYCSFGGIDPNGAGTLKNAAAAGLSTDAYHFPCASQGASAQIGADVNNLHANGAPFGRLWLDIETNASPGCGWSSDLGTNCAFIGDLLSAADALKVPVGVYASKYMWDKIAGSGCTVGSGYPLWYADWDGNPSFSGFTSFGGWSSPTMKQWTDQFSSCGIGADGNYMP